MTIGTHILLGVAPESVSTGTWPPLHPVEMVSM